MYALLDGSIQIEAEHLRAALAAWKYCDDSARVLFGDSTGDRIEEGIISMLRAAPDGVTRTEINNGFNRNVEKEVLRSVLSQLEASGRIVQQLKTGEAPRFTLNPTRE